MMGYRPRKKWWRRFAKRSAVAIILRQTEQGVEALMIKRAEFEGDPWSGHMAFPGGRLEPEDSTSLATARRETLEEIGFDTHQHSDYLGRLSDVTARTRKGPQAMVVSPYLFQANSIPELVLDEEEVADVLWVPLQHFANHQNREVMDWDVRGKPITLPCYFYQQERIWGLSLMMLDELIDIFAR
jgi:8-oxo-dGTP pyrophosphatase MutT (NUDIX family)